jgi:NADPH:quinone reductase
VFWSYGPKEASICSAGGDAACLDDSAKKFDIADAVRHERPFPLAGSITSSIGPFPLSRGPPFSCQQTTLKEQVMRALQFKEFGDPSVLEVVEKVAPGVDERTALVRVMAASINPSDVKNVAGAMKQTTLPRVPGRDFAGVVEAGPAEWIGAEVWGTGGDAGFTRDGTNAELIAVPVASLRRKPETLSFDQAASVGVNYMAAWCGVEAAGLKAGETVLLIGSGGGVGGAAAQIARRIGARVIGADRRPPLADAPISVIADTLIIGSKDLSAEVRAATGGKGADFVFDLVGGVMFRSAVNCLALRGRLVEIAATGRREVTFDLPDFYHNESRLFGVDTLKLDLTASAKVLDVLTPGFVAGDYHAAPIAATYGLGEAQEAYAKVAAGAAGRIVLRPQQ